MVPAAMIDKIWSEPLTIPFSGDISSLPGPLKDALAKFRKDSGMEGKLYLSIKAQSSKFNLNGPVAAFARLPGAGGSPSPTATPDQGVAEPGATPAIFNAAQARQLLGEQIRSSFNARSETDEGFRDEYRNFRIEDLIEEILGWADLAYETNREQSSPYPFKKAPFYHISELHHLPSMDDRIYELLSNQFHAGVSSKLNVNTIQETVLKALVPGITKEEVKAFYELRDGVASTEEGGVATQGQPFRNAEDFFKFLKERVQFYQGSGTRIQDLKNALSQRGIEIVTDETDFLVHVEATVNQNKKTLEAMVSLVEPAQNPVPRMPQQGRPPVEPNTPANIQEKSNFKVTQVRFL
jgi:hypothetical protein